MPITEIRADQLRIGDLVRVDDPQAHQVLDISASEDGRITLTVAPIGLSNAEPTRVVVAADALITRVGTIDDRA